MAMFSYVDLELKQGLDSIGNLSATDNETSVLKQVLAQMSGSQKPNSNRWQMFPQQNPLTQNPLPTGTSCRARLG